MWNLDDLSEHFDKPTRLDDEGYRKRAAVALILKPTGERAQGDAGTVAPAFARPSLLIIERARKDGDPWSGHMAFPGGRHDPEDEDLQATAIRETHEETGVEIERREILGQLDDIDGRHSNLIVSCFVFRLREVRAMRLNHEVARASWLPVDQLLEPKNWVDYRPPGDRWQTDFPGIRVGEQPNQVIWGLTYRLLCDFFSHLEDVELPVHIPPST